MPAEPIELPNASPNVVLVLGKSRSMVHEIWDHDRDPETPDVTRWFSLHQGIESLVSGFDGSVRLGTRSPTFHTYSR